MSGSAIDVPSESVEEDWLAGQEDAVKQDDPVSLCLKEMARVPLLTAEEEVALAKRMEAGRQAAEKLDGGRLGSKGRERAQAVVADGLQAREHMIRANGRLVVSIAKKYIGRGVPFLDLIQEGSIGLMTAVEKFDHTLGYRLSTYATWWIRQAVSRAVADQGRTVRVPVDMGHQISRLFKTARRLEQENGRVATPEELAEAMEEDVRKVTWMLKVARHPDSLERPLDNDDGDELADFVEDEGADTASAGEDEALREQLEIALSRLPARDRQYLKLYYGLAGDADGMTLDELGEAEGLTRARIGQIRQASVEALRTPTVLRMLAPFMEGAR